MTEPILDIRDLYVRYKTDLVTNYAVNGISLQLEKGQCLGLVGETGAGKTTAALSVLRLLPPKVGEITGGSITFCGEDILKLTEADMRLLRGNRISMIFQDPMTSLNPVLQVGEQIEEAVRLHMPGTREEVAKRAEDMLEMVGIPKTRKNEYPHQFSGGMKQRVVIAIALSCNPLLLIADEPTTALDVTIQAQILDMMDDLKRKMDTAMILITHDLAVVAENCELVAIMYAGEIIETGRAEDIFEGGQHHPYTEGLFHSVPDIDRDTDRLTPIEGLMPDPARLPGGCKFHPRCKYRKPICDQKRPTAWNRGSHHISCHLFGAGQQEELKGEVTGE